MCVCLCRVWSVLGHLPCVCDMLHVGEKQNVFEYNNDCI